MKAKPKLELVLPKAVQMFLFRRPIYALTCSFIIAAKETWKAEQQQLLEAELAQAKQTWLDTELKQAHQSWQDEHGKDIEQAVESARQTWQETDLGHALAQAKVEWESQVQAKETAVPEEEAEQAAEQQLYSSAQEVDMLRLKNAALERDLASAEEAWVIERQQLTAEKCRIEQKMANREEAWLTDKQQLLREKEAERKQAVAEVQAQCEQDYKDFLQEHQSILNDALKSARQQFAEEKVSLVVHCSCL